MVYEQVTCLAAIQDVFTVQRKKENHRNLAAINHCLTFTE